MNSFDLINRSGFSVETPSKPVRVLGIDLGTTNSTVAKVTWTPGELPECRTPAWQTRHSRESPG